jgi:hypothetical protein
MYIGEAFPNQCIWYKCMQSKIQGCLYIMLHMPCQVQEMHKRKLYICYKGAPTHTQLKKSNTHQAPPANEWKLLDLGVWWINQGTQWFSGEPPKTPRTRCSLRQSPLMTQLPRSPSSTLVLRLNQETVHDFILLFMLHLEATGSLERSLLVFSTPGGLTGNDLPR